MMKKEKEHVLTQILKKDAKRVCTPEMLERFWISMEKKLDDRLTPGEQPQTERFSHPVKRFWSFFACFAVIASIIAIRLSSGMGNLMRIKDESVPLSAIPQSTFLSLVIYIVAGFIAAFILTFIINKITIQIRRKQRIRRVMQKLIKLS
jgi:hypothetical protein